MVPSIVRQSVILKCLRQKSTLLGNYEYYYAAGLFVRLSGVQIPSGLEPKELAAALSERLLSYAPDDPREIHLKNVLAKFHPDDKKEAVMDELFRQGLQEMHMWQVQL